MNVVKLCLTPTTYGLVASVLHCAAFSLIDLSSA